MRSAARVARAEDADAVEPAVGRQRADDAGAGRAVAADVTRVVGDDRDALAVEHDGDGALEPADERVVAVDAAVEDADVDCAPSIHRSPTPA